MTIARKELHRLVDSLPAREARTAKRFMEFLLEQSGDPHDHDEKQFYTVQEASVVLELSAKRLRYLIREGVIPAHKQRGRWMIKTDTLRELQGPGAREFLSHPLAQEDLSEEEKAASEEGWQQYLAGKAIPLDELPKEYRHGPGKN